MNKGFSIINIIIIIGIIALIYLGYNNYYSNKNNIIQWQKNTRQNVEINNPDTKIAPKQPSSIETPTSTIQQNSEQTRKSTETKIQTQQPAQPTNTDKLSTKNGLYQNSTYNYQITCPPNWPLRVRSEANISIGTVPPKNGQSAITIEVTSEANNEIEQAKTEAKKYKGLISITETSTTIAGVNGTKITLSNLITKMKDIYIILKKYDFTYAIKYSEESADFVKQAESALATFKFTK